MSMMKEFLIENGFVLEQYPDGKFWILRGHDELFIQLHEDYTNITLYQDGWVDDNLTEEELKDAVNQIKCIAKESE